MFKLLCVVALLFWCGPASGHFDSVRCLPSFGKYPFDEQKFSGDWYVISEVVRPFKLPGKVTCDKLHYSAEEVGNVTRTHIEMRLKLDDGSEKIWEGKGQAVMPGYASTTVMAWKPSDHNKWFGVVGHSVLGTDYGTYALVHSCMELYVDKTDTFSKVVINQIWGRSKTMDKGLLKTLKSVMSSLDIADKEWEDITNDLC